MPKVLYRPYGQQWQVVEPGPGGLMAPGKIYQYLVELMHEHPTAVFEHPEPILPPDLRE